MPIQVEPWQLLAFLASLAITLAGSYFAISKLLFAEFAKRLDERFATVGAQISELGKQSDRYGSEVLKLERELSALRLEMATNYTRREDHNAAIASILVKVDNMSLRIEAALNTPARTGGL
ncbi:MAG: hypothetical protein IIZ92_31075 [Aquincola sp.]|nr:hypothetical protein [Aquincola sp.]